MLAKLKDLQGTEFTEQYHSDQVATHKDAVDLFQRYGDGGENAVLKAWAATTRPALEHNLHMNGFIREWGVGASLQTREMNLRWTSNLRAVSQKLQHTSCLFTLMDRNSIKIPQSKRLQI
ncbi:DUF4142 domain-containing protein (plasmid) [Phyllobacterium sp. A18/5-2]|uniref:DUF4142 domain-containing protein n=1 Tax=Phyllobacterium sp. A18/5-2 TaxID=2978392 RepID=UPI0021C835B0|nr:DUF4142 domain-containing protein [Phyllobacterium sp. A18/5-2]UXN66313.1 DUF4142 domain-containing protein [Phyllobacterium sp. A18/5-2]